MKFLNLTGLMMNLDRGLKLAALPRTGVEGNSPPSSSADTPQADVHHSLRVLIMILAALFLTACATTNKPLQYSSITDFGPDSNLGDQGNKLQSLSYGELIARGNRYLDERNANLARLHFRIAIQKKKDSAPAYAGLGEALALDGENRIAHQILDKALELDGKNRQALLAEARLYEKENNFAQSEIYFNRALKNYPDDPEILTEVAINYGNNGEVERAEMLLLKVVLKKPGDPAAYNNLGFNYLLQGKYPEAVSNFQFALSFRPDDHRIRDNLAAAYALNKEYQKAFDLLSRTEGAAAAYNDLGYFYMKRGLKDSARASFEKALELKPKLYVRAQENLRRLDDEP